MCVVHVRSSEIAKGNINFLYDKLYIIFVFTTQLCIYAVFVYIWYLFTAQLLNYTINWLMKNIFL